MKSGIERMDATSDTGTSSSSCITRTARLGRGIRLSAASRMACACLRLQGLLRTWPRVVDLPADSHRHVAPPLPLVCRGDPEREPEQVRSQRTAGVVFPPGTAQSRGRDPGPDLPPRKRRSRVGGTNDGRSRAPAGSRRGRHRRATFAELKERVNESPLAYPTSCRDPSSLVREPARSPVRSLSARFDAPIR